MRGSAQQPPKYKLNLMALPLIGSIRLFGITWLFSKLCAACLSIYTHKTWHCGTVLHEAIGAVSSLHHFHNQCGLIGKAAALDKLHADRSCLRL
jgi:hypothetical protein